MMLAILEQTLIALPLVFGAYLILSLLKLPDFSIESAYLFGAVGAYLARDLALPFVMLCAMLAGACVGGIVCSLNQLLRIPYLLAAIVTNGLIHGLALVCLQTSTASFHLQESIDQFLFVGCVCAIATGALASLCRSQLGLSLAVYGNNPAFFQNHGISSRYVVFVGITLGHVLVATSGMLFAEANGFVDIQMNFGILLVALTALMLGKLCKKGHRPSLLVPLIGTLLFFTLQQTLLRLGLNLKYFNAFQAICVLALLYVGQKRRSYTLDHLGV